MQITNQKLIESIEALNILKMLKIDAQKAFNLNMLFEEIQQYLVIFNAQNKSIKEKYEDDEEQFSIHQKALLTNEIELEKLDNAILTLSDLEGNKIEPALVGQLNWLITQD
jgi:hypothetical protein